MARKRKKKKPGFLIWLALCFLAALVVSDFLIPHPPSEPKQFTEFTEAERKRIWIELSQNQQRAMKKVNNRFPNIDSSHPDYSKREEFRDTLYRQLYKELTQKYQITQEQLKQIQLEDLSKDWSDTLDPEKVAQYPFRREQSSPIHFYTVIFLTIVFAASPRLLRLFFPILRSHISSEGKNSKKTLLARREEEIFRLAQRKDGRLTISEIVAGTSISFVDAERIMENMVKRGYVGVQISAAGVTIYEFILADTSTSHKQDSTSTTKTARIRCIVTGKLIRDTPEEQVRQDVATRLIRNYMYAREDMEVEFPIKMGRATKWADLVVFPPNEHHGQEYIFLIVETKAQTISAKEVEEARYQLKSYIAASMNCQYALLAWDKWEIYRVFTLDGKRKVKKISDLPRNK